MRNLAIFGMVSLLGLAVSCGGEDCDDGIDNDDDGLVDCEDPDCDACDLDTAEGDADTDTDSDSDTDADSDADSDTDTDLVDEDGDGFYSEASGGDDCDDGDDDIHPGATDECDGIDNDCSGVIDDAGVDDNGDGVDDGACDPGNNFWYEDHVYLAYWVPESFEYAELYCDSIGYHLIVINDDQEQNFLYSEFGPDHSWWIGYQDEVGNNNFTWADSQTSTADAWCDGEPTHESSNECSDDTAEDCAIMLEGTLCWSDRSCECEYMFICEAE